MQHNRFRKTKDGSWIVFGPASQVKVGTVDVRTRAGVVKQVEVKRLGKPFEADGTSMIYGYPDDEPQRTCATCDKPAWGQCAGCQAGLHKECAEVTDDGRMMCQDCT